MKTAPILVLILQFAISMSAGATDDKHVLHEGVRIDNEANHHAPVASTHHEVGVDPDKAMGWLQNGNTRFTNGKLRKDGQSAKDIVRLSSGQKPHSILIACSDSRVPPEIIFDQKLGEIFVVRTAGETLEPSSVASVEYAVAHLGARNIVVLGHTSCGAIKATLSVMNGAEAETQNIAKLVADIRPRLASFHGRGPASADVKDEVLANAKGVASDLIGRSDLIKKLQAEGKVKVNTGVYDLNSGKVIWY